MTVDSGCILLSTYITSILCFIVQVVGHTAMPTLVLAVDLSSWMMSDVAHVPLSYWSVGVDQSCLTIVCTLLMLVSSVKVSILNSLRKSYLIWLSNAYSSMYDWPATINGR